MTDHPAPPHASPALPPDDERVVAARAALPATGAGIYLDTAEAGPLPAASAAAMAEVAEWDLRTGRAAEPVAEDTAARLDEARAAVAAILTTDIDAVVLVHGAAEALLAPAWSIDWQPGDSIVASAGSDAATLARLELLGDRSGVDLRVVPRAGRAATPNTDDDESRDDASTLADFDRQVDGRTRLVVLDHVSATGGAILPVRAIADLARSRSKSVIVVVDGSRAVGAIPVDPAALGVDVYALASHHWLLGPAGIGAAWAADPRFRAELAPLEQAPFERAAVVGFGRSCGWLAMSVGLGWAFERSRAMTLGLAGRLAAIPGVTLATRPDRAAAIVAFRVAGWPSHRVAEELRGRVFAILREVQAADGREDIRVSIAFFTTADEVERLVRAVALVASHTPETLPRRALTMLGGDEA